MRSTFAWVSILFFGIPVRYDYAVHGVLFCILVIRIFR